MSNDSATRRGLIAGFLCGEIVGFSLAGFAFMNPYIALLGVLGGFVIFATGIMTTMERYRR